MEFSSEVVVPVVVVIICVIVGKLIVRKALRLIGWMVLNGHWFPKIMRKDRELRILKTQRVNSHIDLLTDRIDNAKTQEEVNVYYNQLIGLDTKE